MQARYLDGVRIIFNMNITLITVMQNTASRIILGPVLIVILPPSPPLLTNKAIHPTSCISITMGTSVKYPRFAHSLCLRLSCIYVL